MLYIPLALMIAVVGSALCAPERMQNDHEEVETASQIEPEANEVSVAKRSPHYDFGLGKRAYSYVSEYKRLPVYNFGLGKRSSPYSFGLGKRSIDEDSEYDKEINNEGLDDNLLAELFAGYGQSSDPAVKLLGVTEPYMHPDAAPLNSRPYQSKYLLAMDKRARPYSFGLGKRFDDDPVEDVKRTRIYDFGLGKRVPIYSFGLGTAKRGRTYSFGLGKRLSKFNFGLGKRERDLNRFSFGLGKRSAEYPDVSDNENDVDA